MVEPVTGLLELAQTDRATLVQKGMAQAAAVEGLVMLELGIQEEAGGEVMSRVLW